MDEIPVAATEFTDRLRSVLVDASGCSYIGNYDRERYPEAEPSWPRRSLRTVSAPVLRLARRLGLRHVAVSDAEHAVSAALELSPLLPALGDTYAMLQDSYSRHMLVLLLAHRVLGSRHVQLGLAPHDRAVARRRLRRNCCVRRDAATVPGPGGRLDEWDVRSLGFAVRLHAHLLNIEANYVLGQYEYRHGPAIRAQAGDTVVDGGGYIGDTALYFADRIGPDGRVWTFEFEPTNLGALRANLAMNGDLAARIACIERPLWDVDDVPMVFGETGSGTTVRGASDASSRAVASCSIDGLVDAGVLPRVDFVKLDVEGVELRVLRGAERAIRCWKPRLAIAVYHHPWDLVEIPAWIESLDLGYRLYLDHFTCHGEETVLFGVAAE